MINPSLVKIELIGGLHDGTIIQRENPLEKIKFEGVEYKDSFKFTNEGNALYYCSKGEGSLKKSFFEDKNNNG